jgi:hypothetical protein
MARVQAQRAHVLHCVTPGRCVDLSGSDGQP